MRYIIIDFEDIKKYRDNWYLNTIHDYFKLNRRAYIELSILVNPIDEDYALYKKHYKKYYKRNKVKKYKRMYRKK